MEYEKKETTELTASGIMLNDDGLEAVSGGKKTVKKFKCSNCGRISMIVKYRKFVCTECRYERPM